MAAYLYTTDTMVCVLLLQEQFTSAWIQELDSEEKLKVTPHSRTLAGSWGVLSPRHPQNQIISRPSVFFQVMEIEILEFQVPAENNKMLLVWDIEPGRTKAQVYVSPPGPGPGEPLRSRSNVDTCVLSFRRSCTASSPALVLSTSWKCAVMLLRTHLGTMPSSGSTQLFRHPRLSITLMDRRCSRLHPWR